MADSPVALRLADLAVRFGCDLIGDPETRVTRVAGLDRATPDAISFLASKAYRQHLEGTQAAAVILAPEHADECPVAALVSKRPYALYARIAATLHPEPDFEPGVHPTAVVDPSAKVSATGRIAANCVIDADTEIGSGCFVGPGCTIGRGCSLGQDTRLVARVSLCDDVRAGQRCVFHPGVVIGSDGFGLAEESGEWIRVPQLGGVQIGNDVDVGSNTTIDRGAVDDTILEDGVKLDNQIQVGHNVRIGAHTVVAGSVGISGSVTIGRHCQIGGQVGFVGHLSVVDNVIITGRSMVTQSVTQPGIYSGGLPMDEAARFRKNAARFRRLDDLARRLAALERSMKKSMDS